ncbi:MAG: DMT family transporter [Alphaproteobacteria bacterium]|nr:DMT family transporter [Alphaproteobacteria bacterium]
MGDRSAFWNGEGVQSSNTLKGVGQTLVCVSLIALLPVISNGRPAGFGALSFAFFLSFYQFLFSVPLMLKEMFSGQRGMFSPASGSHSPRRAFMLTLLTGLLFAVAIFLFVFGVEAAGTVSGAIALQASPVFAIIIEAVFLGRRKSAAELGLTALLLVTLYGLGTNGAWTIAGLNIWFLAVLAVPLLWAIAHVIVRQELGKSPITPAQVTFFRVGLSALFLGLVLLATDARGLFAAFTTPQWQMAAALMGLVYYLELLIWFSAIRHIPVSLAATIGATSPALTMVFASLFLHEAILPYQVAAFIVLVLAIAGLTLLGARTRPATA